MILGELKGVVSPESWTSECSEGKSLDTSGRLRPASEGSWFSWSIMVAEIWVERRGEKVQGRSVRPLVSRVVLSAGLASGE